MEKKISSILAKVFISLLVIAAIYFYWSIISKVILAIVFAFILRPAVSWLEAKKLSKTTSIAIVYSAIILFFVILVLFIVPKLVYQGESLLSFFTQKEVQEAITDASSEKDENCDNNDRIINIFMNYDKETDKFIIDSQGNVAQDKELSKIQPDSIKVTKVKDEEIKPLFHDINIPYLNQVVDIITKIDEKLTFIDIISELRGAGSVIRKQIVKVPRLLIINIEKIAGTFAVIFMTPFIAFFILKDRNLISRLFAQFVPNRTFEIYISITHKIGNLISNFIRALLLEVIIVGLLSSIVLTFIGVKYSLIIGLLAGFANMIPYFGPFLGVIFAIISVLMAGQELSMILAVIIGMWIVQLLDNNIIYPIVIGKSTNMHPLLVFLTVMAGGYTLGIVGMIVSVPLVHIVIEITKELFNSLRKYEIL